ICGHRTEVTASNFRDLWSPHRGGIAESLILPRRADHKRSPQTTELRPNWVRHDPTGSRKRPTGPRHIADDETTSLSQAQSSRQRWSAETTVPVRASGTSTSGTTMERRDRCACAMVAARRSCIELAAEKLGLYGGPQPIP